MAAARRRAAVAVVPDIPEPAPTPAAVPDGQGVLLPALVPDQPDAPPRVLVPLGRFDWERVLRDADISASAKLAGFVAATYADADGTKIRPGEARIAAAMRKGPQTARRAVAELVAAGLLEQVSRGGGPNGLASVYRLVAPAGTKIDTEQKRPRKRKNSGHQ